MEKERYKASEAQELLGIKKGQFYDTVKKLGIELELPPNKQRGGYILASDVQKIANFLNITFKETIKGTKGHKSITTFRTAHPGDAQQMHELGERVMRRSGGYGIRPELLTPYLNITRSEIGHVLERDETIIGYFTIMPFKHDQLMKRMREEVYTADFKPEDLPFFEPGKPIDCYVWEVMSDPNQKQIGQYLIRKLLDFFHTLGKRGVEIEGVYATASSPEGINLCRRIGMHIMDELPDVAKAKSIPFELRVQENRNWFTKSYIQALKSYKKRQYRMQIGADAPASSEEIEIPE